MRVSPDFHVFGVLDTESDSPSVGTVFIHYEWVI